MIERSALTISLSRDEWFELMIDFDAQPEPETLGPIYGLLNRIYDALSNDDKADLKHEIDRRKRRHAPLVG